MDFVVIIQSFLHKDQKISYDLIPKTNKNRLGVVIFVILGGVPYLSLYAAVQYVPMGDIVALSALCPILAYVVARVVLKHKFTVLKVPSLLVTTFR